VFSHRYRMATFDPSRREFFRTVVRWAAAPAMIGGAAAMSTRKGETCINNTICRGCGVVATCGLPQALSFRDATQTEERDAGRS